MTITNRAELDKCRESAEKQLNAYDCRILVCQAPAVLQPVPKKFIKKCWESQKAHRCYH